VQYLSYLLKKLEILQKKVIRAMSWSDFNAPTRSIFLGYGILRLKEYNIFHNACTMYQRSLVWMAVCVSLFPSTITGTLNLTRNKHIIIGKNRRLKSTGMSVVCRGPWIWNELDDNL